MKMKKAELVRLAVGGMGYDEAVDRLRVIVTEGGAEWAVDPGGHLTTFWFDDLSALTFNDDDASIFVFRSGVQPGVSRLCDCEPEEALVFGLDLSRADGILLAERFELQPRDVVYVSSTDFARYNRVVNQILPTVSTLFQLDRLVTD